MQSADAAYRMLKEYHGLGPEDVGLIRHLVYTFECRLARSWRIGRVFLAGDAAHTNPPYLGQGACSGMRDASNLAWKLDLVLRGVADDALLDSYERERLPHAKTLMLGSRSLGLVANTANPVKAAIRDLMFGLKLAPNPKFPILTDGVLARDPNGTPMSNAGTLPPQGRITVAGSTRRFDEHAGFGFVMVSRADVMPQLSDALRTALREIGLQCFVLDGRASQATDAIAIGDTDSVYGQTLSALQADVMIIRPDFVLYGHATRADVNRLLHGLLRELYGAARTPPGRGADYPSCQSGGRFDDVVDVHLVQRSGTKRFQHPAKP
jgi:3-(3-hydroxy-phenyl)propionate hydroxylase